MMEDACLLLPWNEQEVVVFYHLEEYWCLAQLAESCFSGKQDFCLLLKVHDVLWVWGVVHWLWCYGVVQTGIFSLEGHHLEEKLPFAEELSLGPIGEVTWRLH